MKKKSIKHLTLGKKTVSKLNKNEVAGGTRTGVSFFIDCITPGPTAGCGTQIPNCNSMQVCETVERDKNTLPIC
jgi:hypothetical protein